MVQSLKFNSFCHSLVAVVAILLQACDFGGRGNASEHQPSQNPSPPAEIPATVEVLTDDLEYPWGLVMLPNKKMLITEKPGRLRIFDLTTEQLSEPLNGVPDVSNVGQGGLLDVALHPDFVNNRWVYLSYSAGADGNLGTEVGRGQLTDEGLSNFEKLFEARPKVGGGLHFGSRLVFNNEGYLFITLGDRGQQDQAQNLASHLGSVIRLHDDGTVPADNPFVDRPNALPEIYSYGHRNIQGAALHPGTGELWIHEHGPQGGDEINVIRAGANYGWPAITYGVNYGSGTAIGEGTEKEGMEQPFYYWDPSIAPSGMAFYNNPNVPLWHGDLLVGALASQYLAKLDVDGRQVGNEKRLLKDEYGRLRAVTVDDSGRVFVLNDDSPAQLIRLTPSEE